MPESANVLITAAGNAAIEETDLRYLAELAESRCTKEITDSEYRALRSNAAQRVSAAQRRIVVRSATALDGGVTGPGAHYAWQTLPLERRAAALRFLFTAIRVGQSSTTSGVFDQSRIDVVPNPL